MASEYAKRYAALKRQRAAREAAEQSRSAEEKARAAVGQIRQAVQGGTMPGVADLAPTAAPRLETALKDRETAARYEAAKLLARQERQEELFSLTEQRDRAQDALDLERTREAVRRRMGGTASSPERQAAEKTFSDLSSRRRALKKQVDEDAYQEQLEQGFREMSLWDATVGSAKRGFFNTRYGQELWHQMLGGESEAGTYKDILDRDEYRYTTLNPVKKAVSGAAELLGQQFRQYTDPRSVAMGGTAAVAASLAGKAGPQALLPEEVITVPGAFMTGMAMGGAASNVEIEGGLAYQEMVENGVSHETARNIAAAVGGVNGILEFMQADELLKSFRVLSRNPATYGAARKLGEVLADYGLRVGNETLQEVAQEAVTIGGNQLGTYLETGRPVYSQDEVLDRLKETALSSALSFGILGAPGAGAQVYQTAARSAANTRQTGAWLSGMGEDVTRAVVREGLDSAPDTRSYALARQLKDRLDRGETVSDRQLGRLYQANVETIAAEEQENETRQDSPRMAAEGREGEGDTNHPADSRTGYRWAETAEFGGLKDSRAERETGTTAPTTQARRRNIAAPDALSPEGGIENILSPGISETQRQANLARMAEVTDRAMERSLGRQGAKAAREFYDGTVRPDRYFGTFAAWYQAGVTGMDRSKVRTLYTGALNAAQQEAAYLAGQWDARDSLEAERGRVKFAAVYGQEAGLVGNEYAQSMDRGQALALDRLAKAVGVKLQVVEGIEHGAEGRLLPSGVIELSAKAQNPLLAVAGHEITHRLQELAPEEYRLYRDFALAHIAEQGGRDSVEEMRDRYERSGVQLTTQEAMDEVAAEFTEAMVQDGALFRDLTRQHRSVAQKVLDAVKEFIRKVRAAFRGERQRDSAAMRAYGVDMDTLEQAAKLWQDAFDAAQRQAEEAAKKTEKQDGTQDISKTRFSMSETDSTGRALTKKQQEFFNDSAIRMDEYGFTWDSLYGSLVPVYHATYDDFTIFDREKIGEVTSENATENKYIATAYLGFWFNTSDLSKERGLGDRAVGVYLNIKRPYNAGTLENLANEVVEIYANGLDEPESFDDSFDPRNAADSFLSWLELNDFDGIVIEDEEMGGTSFVALYPEQIKLTSNKNPSVSDPDIRYSLKRTEVSESEELSDRGTRYSLRKKDPPRKVGIAYKVFLARDGQLYPPMVANPGGAGTPVGVWLDADVGQAAPPSKTGRAQVQGGGKGTAAGKISLAFRPGWHLGDIPLAKQFARKNPETGVKDLFPGDFVWAECEYAMDVDYQEEAMSYGYTESGKFRHSYAGLPKLPADGYYRYRTNPNPDTVPWIITGAMRVRRILTDAETDAICREAGVEPMQRQGGAMDEARLKSLGLEAGVKEQGRTRFSIKRTSKMTLAEQLKRYYDGKMASSDAFCFGQTPAILAQSGLESLPLAMTIRDFRKSTKEKHNIPRRVLKNLMRNLETPLFSFGGGDRTAFVLDDIDGDGKPLLAAIQSGILMDNRTVNIMQSLYGLDHPELWLKNQIANGKKFVLYDEKRANAFLRSYGYLASQGDGIHSLDDSIHQTGEEVNGGTKFSLPADRDSLTALRRENERLRGQVERWKGELKRTENGQVDPKAVERTARELIREYGADLEAADIAGDLLALYNYMGTGREGKSELTYTEARRRAEEIAGRLVDSAVETDDQMYREYEQLREYLRDKKLTLSRADWNSMDGLNELRRHNMGRMVIGLGKTNVDQVYQEMGEMWPELFNEQSESTIQDQLWHISEVLDSVYSITSYNPFSWDMEQASAFAANEIMERFFDQPNVRKTFADRQAQKLEQAREKGRERVRQVRSEKDRRIEQVREQDRERAKAAIARVRQQKDGQIQRMRDHYAQVREDRAARRLDSRARTRLLNIARRLKNRKLPAVNRALLDKYIGELDTVSKSMTGQTLEKLTRLRRWYEDRRETDPDFIPDPAIEERLKRLERRQISDLSADEVALLTEVLLHIENELSTEKKLIDSQDRRDTYHMAEQVIADIQATGGNRGPLKGLDDFLVTNTLSPVRQARRMTGWAPGDPLVKLMEAMADGQRTMLDYQMRAQRPFRGFAQDRKFSRSFSGPKAETVTITGMTAEGERTVEITPAMRVSLYLHSLNGQNLRHIRDGGVTVPDMKLYRKGKLAEAYNNGVTLKLTPSQVKEIAGGMTEGERRFAQTAHRYFNETSREAINAVSEKLKGYSIAQVEDYYPIRSDPSFTRADFEALKFDGTLEGMGFLKDRQIKASNPILLRDANAEVEQSIQMHSRYVGLAIPVRNFNKVWGVTTGSFNADGSRNAYESSVQKAVRQNWGEAGYQYVERLMGDLQGGRKTDGDLRILNRVRSGYAGAVLTLNASVAMKQAASYPTAAAVLGWKPLARAMGDVGRVDLDLIAKYTPLQWYRSLGFSDKELGDLKTAGRSLPAALNWVQGADLLTTRKLWKASEYYVRDHNRALARGSDAYYRAVADIYNRVIEETQPNYTAMQRPHLLRSDSSLVQSIFMFKTQPFQNFNIVYDAAGAWLAAERRKEGRAEARANLGRAVTSQLAQLAVFAGMTMAWALFRGRKRKYEDEEGELTPESVLSALLKDMAGGALASVPGGAEAWEGLSARFFDGTAHGLNVVSVTAVTELVSGLNGMGEAVGEAFQAVRDGKDVDPHKLWLELDPHISAVSKAAGVPYENVVNLVKATVRNTCIQTLGEYQGEYAALRMFSDPEKDSGTWFDLLYRAMKKDRGAYEAICADMQDRKLFDRDTGEVDENGEKIITGTKDRLKSAMESRMMDSQGVDHVDELEKRWLPPAAEREFDAVMEGLTGDRLWDRASQDQRDRAEKQLYTLEWGGEPGEKIREKIDGGRQYGLDETEYLLFRLALSMADQPSESGKLGSYTNAERQAAIEMLTGLNDRERSYLWSVSGGRDSSDPWGRGDR